MTPQLLQDTQRLQHAPSPAPSVASITSVSSSATSVWSVGSGISSTATSVQSHVLDNFSAPPTAVIPPLPSQGIAGPAGSTADTLRRIAPPRASSRNGMRPAPINIHHTPVPIEQRQNPRRTNRLATNTTQGGDVAYPSQPPPVPTLQRQADRKVNFVENLVDSAAQIVETIWQPPKYLSQSRDPVLPLRTFIQETLRRSRTSYSTLQVALYYLIVIRPHLPGNECDTSGMSETEAQLVRAKQCGRRMFLAALILASKYLQDRNYSARAWSKISGLNTQEININEMAFLHAVDWKLHISEVVFQKWTDLVLKYTSAPSPSPVSPTRCSPWSDEEERKKEWCALVAKLSPDLREVDLPSIEPARIGSGDLSPAHVELVSSSRLNPSTGGVKNAHTAPTSALPPRTVEPQVQAANAFKALHPTAPTPPTEVLRRPSSTSLVARSNTGHKAGGAMASAVQTMRSSVMSNCSQESYPGSQARRRSSEALDRSPIRRSSLASCITNDSLLPAPGSQAPPSAAASTPKVSTHERWETALATRAPASGTKIVKTPRQTRTPYLEHVNPLSSLVPMSPRLNALPGVLASPRSDAAIALNLLKSATPSPATTPLNRKRSCPSTSNSSGVTPRLQGLRGFGSPVISALSPGNGNKRVRCGWGEKDGFGEVISKVAQGVR